jgi:hypothetical protein
MTMWQLLSSALGGSALTYFLSAHRENRRMAETYRQPQRAAVGAIVEAENELISVGNQSSLIINDEANRGQFVTGRPVRINAQKIAGPIAEARRAGTKFVSALELARIVIVDPHCSHARYEVDRALDPVAEVLGRPDPRNFGEAAQYAIHLQWRLRGLDERVEHLVNVSASRLGPVIPWRVKLRYIRQGMAGWAAAKTKEWRDLEAADRDG